MSCYTLLPVGPSILLFRETSNSGFKYKIVDEWRGSQLPPLFPTRVHFILYQASQVWFDSIITNGPRVGWIDKAFYIVASLRVKSQKKTNILVFNFVSIWLNPSYMGNSVFLQLSKLIRQIKIFSDGANNKIHLLI